MNETQNEDTQPPKSLEDQLNIRFPSIRDDIAAADYHLLKAISKHGLDEIAHAPALHRHNRDNPPLPTPAMRFGSLYHTAILEPGRYHDETAVEPSEAPRRPSIAQRNAKKPSDDTLKAIEFWDEWDAASAGKTLVTFEEDAKLRAMQAAIMADPAYRNTLANIAFIEPSLFWVDPETGVLCRARPDAIRRDDIFLDPKTCEDASKAAFERSCFNFRYHVQAAFYADAWAILNGGKAPPFAFLAQEKSPPYLCAVHIASPAMIAAGRIIYRRDMRRYAECLEKDVWPGLYATPQVINLPPWAEKEISAAA